MDAAALDVATRSGQAVVLRRCAGWMVRLQRTSGCLPRPPGSRPACHPCLPAVRAPPARPRPRLPCARALRCSAPGAAVFPLDLLARNFGYFNTCEWTQLGGGLRMPAGLEGAVDARAERVFAALLTAGAPAPVMHGGDVAGLAALASRIQWGALQRFVAQAAQAFVDGQGGWGGPPPAAAEAASALRRALREMEEAADEAALAEYRGALMRSLLGGPPS